MTQKTKSSEETSKEATAAPSASERKIAEALSDPSLAPIAAELRALFRPSIVIDVRAATSETAPPVGTSRIGGDPDLPAGFVWPRQGRAPLTFLAQLDLAAAAPFDHERLLPREGLLWFFLAPEYAGGFGADERGGWKVVHGPADGLTRTAPPASENEPLWAPAGGRVPACTLAFRSEPSLPHKRAPAVLALAKAHPALATKIEEILALDLREDHRLLGYPDRIDRSDEEVGELLGGFDANIDPVAAFNGATSETTIEKDWQLLVQLSSGGEADLGWGDMGYLQIWIPRQALAARDFDRAWAISFD